MSLLLTLKRWAQIADFEQKKYTYVTKFLNHFIMSSKFYKGF